MAWTCAEHRWWRDWRCSDCSLSWLSNLVKLELISVGLNGLLFMDRLMKSGLFRVKWLSDLSNLWLSGLFDLGFLS